MRTLIVGKDAIAVMFHVSVLCLNPISFESLLELNETNQKIFKLNLTSLVTMVTQRKRTHQSTRCTIIAYIISHQMYRNSSQNSCNHNHMFVDFLRIDSI
eukprot:116192_1